jgi:hypothetical protein
MSGRHCWTVAHDVEEQPADIWTGPVFQSATGILSDFRCESRMHSTEQLDSRRSTDRLAIGPAAVEEFLAS